MASSIEITNPVEEACGVMKFTATITAHTDGSVTAVSTPFDIDGWVFMATVNPGATAPTDNYDIELKDEDGIDVFGGELMNRDTANSEQCVPKIGNDYGPRYVAGPLQFNISNNSQNGAISVVTIYFHRERV